MRAAVAKTQTQWWPDLVPAVQLTINSAPREDNHLSPYQVMFGNPVRLPVDLAYPRKPIEEYPSQEDYLGRVQKYLRKCHDVIRSPPDSPADFELPPPIS